MKQKISFILGFLIFLCPYQAMADDLSLGLGLAYSTSPYKGHDDLVLPAPVIIYNGEHLFFRGLSGGVHLLNEKSYNLSLGLSYLPHHFKPSNTDDKALKQLDRRRSTLAFDLIYALRTDFGHFGLKASQDILGHSEGQLVNLSYAYPFDFDPLLLRTGAGLSWASAKHLRYYYGISSQESQKSGLMEYEPNQAISPYLSLDATYRLTQHLNLNAGSQLTFLNSEIKNSPMVDSSRIFSAYMGVAYNF
ncbi:MAG: MipA/OmpV family protein [Candidatus Adiutrix sp.]